MSRRRQKASDSLDLLLDTICNTFGGILFIAMLVVILLQLQGETTESTTGTDVTAVDLASLRNELDVRIDGLQRLRDLLDSQRRTLATLAPADLAQLVAENAAANEAHDQRHQEREKLLQRMADLAESIERTDQRLQAAETDLNAARDRIESLEQQLSKNRDSRRRELRTPVQFTEQAKVEIGCVLQYGRFYVWHRYDSSGARLGLNADEFIVLDEGDADVYTTPRPTKGIPVDGTARCRARITSRLAQFSKSECYIGVMTRPDSFAEWAILRDLLAAQGYEYRLHPLNDDDRMQDRGGTGTRVQ